MFAATDGAVIIARKGYDCVLGIGALQYLKRHGEGALPEALGSFKELLAHLVVMVKA